MRGTRESAAAGPGHADEERKDVRKGAGRDRIVAKAHDRIEDHDFQKGEERRVATIAGLNAHKVVSCLLYSRRILADTLTSFIVPSLTSQNMELEAKENETLTLQFKIDDLTSRSDDHGGNATDAGTNTSNKPTRRLTYHGASTLLPGFQQREASTSWRRSTGDCRWIWTSIR